MCLCDPFIPYLPPSHLFETVKPFSVAFYFPTIFLFFIYLILYLHQPTFIFAFAVFCLFFSHTFSWIVHTPFLYIFFFLIIVFHFQSHKGLTLEMSVFISIYILCCARFRSKRSSLYLTSYPRSYSADPLFLNRRYRAACNVF